MSLYNNNKYKGNLDSFIFPQHGQSSGGLLCCCRKAAVNPDEDRVELAFRRIDLNNDGFITWDEFVQVRRMLSIRID